MNYHSLTVGEAAAPAQAEDAVTLARTLDAGRQGKASFGNLAQAYIVAEKLGLPATMAELRGIMAVPARSTASYLVPALVGLGAAGVSHVVLHHIYSRKNPK